MRCVAMEDDQLFAICNREQTLADAWSRIAEDADLRFCLDALELRRRASLILAIINGRTHVGATQATLEFRSAQIKEWVRRELDRSSRAIKIDAKIFFASPASTSERERQ